MINYCLHLSGRPTCNRSTLYRL